MLFGRCDDQTWIPQQTVYQVELVSQVIDAPRPALSQPAPLEPEPNIERKEEAEPPELETKPEPKEEKPVDIQKSEPKKSPKETPSNSEAKSDIPNPKVTSGDSTVTGENRVTIGTENFPFAYYVNLLQSRIKQNWQSPPNLRQKLSAVIGFKVLLNGKFIDIVVEKSSGQFLFDQAAQRAIHYAGPMPPLPNQFLENQLSVHIEFEGL